MICFLSAKKRAAKPGITVRFYYPWGPKNNFFFRREGQRERTSEEEAPARVEATSKRILR